MAYKDHGATSGLFNVVATTKGQDIYTRVVLALDIAAPGEGEMPVAMRMFERLYDRVGYTFPFLTYDGALMPIHWQQLMARYGVCSVNRNTKAKWAETNPVPEAIVDAEGRTVYPIGRGVQRSAIKRKDAYAAHEKSMRTPKSKRKYTTLDKLTYVTQLESIRHEVDGQVHWHHHAADDGAVYEIKDSMDLGGHPAKLGAPLERFALVRLRESDGRYFFRLTLRGACPHGDYLLVIDLKETALAKGRLPLTEIISNVRPLPEADERFSETNNQRNQVEAYFSWLEDCFTNKDQAARWGRHNQLMDMLGAALLANSQAWAHLAHRHPVHALELEVALEAKFPLNLDRFKTYASSAAA